MYDARSRRAHHEWLLGRGRKYVVWRYGVLYAGIPSSVLAAVIYDTVSTRHLSNGRLGSFLVLLMIFLISIGLVGGYGIGISEWRAASRLRGQLTDHTPDGRSEE